MPRQSEALHYSAGLCGFCGRNEASAPATSVVSKSFGSWSDIAVCQERGGRYLCEACIFSLRSTNLRHKATVVTDEPSVTHPTQARLQQLLLDGPLPGGTGVMVPVTGKKAIVLSARWGTVATDTGSFSWQASHSAALRALIRLRALGFREGGFTELLPPLVTLSRLSPDDRKEAQELWRSLRAAREDRAFLPLVTRISRSDS